MTEALTEDLVSTRPRFGVVAGNGQGLSREQVERVLKRRAVMLSRTPQADQESGEFIQIVSFTLGREAYGMEISLIREIQPLNDLTLIPCTPDFVVGAVNIRGKIISVIDICRLFGSSSQDTTDSPKVIVVSYQDLELGILAGEVSEVISLSKSEIEQPLATLSGVREEYIKGEYVMDSKKNVLVILDVENILKDKRMIIKEEVG